jgi:hypothetical protein
MMQHSSLPNAERRRANFAAGHRLNTSDPDGSYQHMRAELGEENTNRLITNIGTLAMSSGIAASGVSLSDAVKRIIGSLTPGERSAIASGGAPPPRVQALLDSEVKAAQQQRQTQLAAATNTDGTTGEPHRYGAGALLGGAFARAGYNGRGDYNGVGSSSGSGSSSSYVSNPSSVSMLNYAGTPYAGTGMTYSTFSYLRNDLRSENFSGQNILHAGQDSRRHGFNPNDRPVARDFAIVDRDDGARRDQTNSVYSRFDNQLANDAEIQRLKRERDQAQSPEAKRAVEDQMRARTNEIAGRSGMSNHIDTAPTEAARSAHTRNRDRFIHRHMGLQADHRAEIGDDAAQRLTAADRAPVAQREAPVAQIAATVRSTERRTDASLDADLLAAANPTAPRRDAAADTPAPTTTVAAATAAPTTTVAAATEEKKPDAAKPVQTAAAKPVVAAPKMG